MYLVAVDDNGDERIFLALEIAVKEGRLFIRTPSEEIDFPTAGLRELRSLDATADTPEGISPKGSRSIH